MTVLVARNERKANSDTVTVRLMGRERNHGGRTRGGVESIIAAFLVAKKKGFAGWA